MVEGNAKGMCLIYVNVSCTYIMVLRDVCVAGCGNCVWLGL
jgi:hypothetical protein